MDNNNSEDDNSDDGLQIVIDSPTSRPRKRAKKELNENDREIIACVEQDLEENLEEKAARANLSTKHVKHILKQVVTNEHVLALVRHAENPDENDEPVTVYEPKYTRAKTKQLLSSNTTPVLPWAPTPPPKSPSEVNVLFSEDLQEDSSGDEYVPEDTTIQSTTTDNVLDTSQATSVTEEEQANIALRTRSKLCLSHTPLEAIEEQFIPPDITTDMYDMDCDDDVWRDFLKTFTRPLDEALDKAPEDDDHDPEYNILADEEIDQVDKEELRADRAVTVSRKEFNCLMAELFEFADTYDDQNKQNNKTSTEDSNLDDTNNRDTRNAETDLENDVAIKKSQIPILAQQMRQHVQMLAQNFLLTYEHPEFSDMAPKFKDFLLSIKEGAEGKTESIYQALNLDAAVKVVTEWENLFSTRNTEVLETQQYVAKVIVESVNAKVAGLSYVVTFPPLLMKTVSNSEAFIYPNLLPRIPFKVSSLTKSSYHYFTYSEQNLIAHFLEDIIPYLKQDPFNRSKSKKVSLSLVSEHLHYVLMPMVSPKKLATYIRNKKHPSSEENPIKFYARNRKAPPTVHYVVPIENNELVPPCKRNPESLPYQWRKYIHPDYKENVNLTNYYNYYDSNQVILVSSPLQLCPVTNVSIPPVYNINLAKKVISERRIYPKGPLPQLVTQVQKKPRKRKHIDQSKSAKRKDLTMLPDMPSLGNTPVKNQNRESDASTSKSSSSEATTTSKEQELSFQNSGNFGFLYYNPSSEKQVRHSFEGIEFNIAATTKESQAAQKDNPDDINELMKASSTVKNVTKKEPSGAEKKRLKARREYCSNLTMATPDSLEKEIEKEENFADLFYNKLRHSLTSEDYEKIIDILGNYDGNKDEFIEFYNKVQAILLPKYPDLSDEFLLFLTDKQAYDVGQLMPYFVMKDMDRFIKKLQIYFKEQPFHLRKILKCLTELTENSDTTMETIKITILPLLKGNAALCDWFLQLFPDERPPNILSNGSYEVIDICKEQSRPPDENIYETVTLPDTEDPYGGPACICPCHNVENPPFSTRQQHCIKCGLKFIQGKIYVQTGKALRPAVVSFLTNPDKDHMKRLNAVQQRKSDTSPNKQAASPNKDQKHEETRNSNESEDEGDGPKKKRRSKSRSKRKTSEQEKLQGTKPDSKESAAKTSDKNKPECTTSGSKPLKNSSTKRIRKRSNSEKKVVKHKPGATSGQQKRLAESLEVECGPSDTVIRSGESESEIFESSQDVTNTESDDSNFSSNSSPVRQPNSSKRINWTREEDKTILQAFRQRNDNEETFKHISDVLNNRSIIDIKNRFHKLLSLLQQMSSNSTA